MEAMSSLTNNVCTNMPTCHFPNFPIYKISVLLQVLVCTQMNWFYSKEATKLSTSFDGRGCSHTSHETQHACIAISINMFELKIVEMERNFAELLRK